MSAATKVKGLSPEILHNAQGQGVHGSEANIGARAKGECATGVPGSETAAGIRTDHSGTWENRNVPEEASDRAEEAIRKYVIAVVGPTHSRGVNRVMLGEPEKALEGVGGFVQSERRRSAIH